MGLDECEAVSRAFCSCPHRWDGVEPVKKQNQVWTVCNTKLNDVFLGVQGDVFFVYVQSDIVF